VGRFASRYWPGRFGDREALHRGIFILECQLIDITFGGVCSGISAPAVAWHVLGWRAVWEAEIEDFPSKVLAHHYPQVPNLGDMTKIAAMVRARQVAAPDVLVGGTPCQAFSVAGLRESLDDARGQLTLAYVELADEIDRVRIADGEPECIIVWENVPGVLNTKDNAFGCFLAGLAGEDCALVPPGGKWPNAGCVYGPKRTVAWRVTDAQYFDVAQRRARVFVVASARDGFDPAEVLFEFDGVRRDTPPSREPGQETAGTLTGSLGRRGGQPDCGSTPGLLQPVGRLGGSDLICMAHGQGGAEIRFDSAPTLTCNHEAPIAAYSVALRGREGGATAELGDDLANCLRASGGGGDKPHVLAPVCIQNATRGKDQNGLGVSEPGAPMYTLDQGSQHGVAYAFDSRQECVSSPHVFGALGSSSPQAQAVATEWELVGGWAVRRLMPIECERLQAFPDNYTLIPVKKAKKRSKMYDYAEIDGQLWQLAADGPRYKALGNSMCVFNMRWIGQRIHNHLTNPYGDLI